MKKISTFILTIIFAGTVFSQVPNYTFAHGFGSPNQDQSTAVAADASGNNYVTGNFSDVVDFNLSAATNTLAANGFADIFVAKYNSAGQYQWAFGFGGSGNYDSGQGIAIDAAGNVYVTGYFGDDVDFDPGAGLASYTAQPGNNDAFIAKYNNNGQFQWVHHISGAGIEQGVSVTIDPTNNDVVVTGKYELTIDVDGTAATTTLTSEGGLDIFVSRYSSAGIFISAFSVGGPGTDLCNDISTDGAGNVYITGGFDQTADFDPSAVVFPLTPFIGANAMDAFVAKYNNADVFQWAFNFGETTHDAGYSVVNDATDNSVYVTGYYSNKVDFDPSASTNSMTAVGNNDIFIAKYNSAGGFMWVQSVGGNNNDYGSALSIDGGGGIFVTGSFEDIVDFDPSASTSTLASQGLQDVFIAKYTGSGALVWAFPVGGAGADFGFGIANSTTGTNIYCAGLLQGTVDFDPSASTANVLCAGVEDAFIAGYVDPTVGITKKETTANNQLYPNPFINELTFDLNNVSTVTVTDVLGKTVFEQKLSEGIHSIDLNDQPKGIYFVTINANSSRQVLKAVKE
ncbi:MAG: hypothetical protein K0S32_723 [Bacteroidetes bacterium]|jgi:hypothetical protein|nr:hypothetical protein [Bacteroidota bacterium]